MTTSFSSLLSLRNPGFVRFVLLYLVFLSTAFVMIPVIPSMFTVGILIMAGIALITSQFGLVILLYLILLPTNGLIPKEQYLLGMIGPPQAIGLVSLLAFSRLKRSKGKDKLQKVALHLLLIVILYLFYTNFKNALYGLHGFSLKSVVTKSFNIIPLYLPLLLLVLRVNQERVRNWMFQGMFFTTLNLVLFCYISPLLPEMGFYSLGTESAGLNVDVDKTRYLGIVGDGDSNTVGAIFAIMVGFLAARPKSLRKSPFGIALGAMCVVGIALTGSRTAFIALIVVCLLFFMNKGHSRIKLNLLVVGLFFIALTLPLW